MRANRERGEHGTENASSCSGPNGEVSFEQGRGVVWLRCDRDLLLIGQLEAENERLRRRCR